MCVCVYIYIMYISPSRPWEEVSDNPGAEKRLGKLTDLAQLVWFWTCAERPEPALLVKGAEWGHGVWLYLKPGVPRVVWAVEQPGPVALLLGV